MFPNIALGFFNGIGRFLFVYLMYLFDFITAVAVIVYHNLISRMLITADSYFMFMMVNGTAGFCLFLKSYLLLVNRKKQSAKILKTMDQEVDLDIVTDQI